MAIKSFHHVFGAFLLFLVLQTFMVNSRPLQSLQNLNGAQKGDVVTGIVQVKKYLKAFGYYPHDIDVEIDDHFDDSLETALRGYQENFHLQVTGKIDPDKVKTIMTPRCGVPAIIHNRTSNGTKGDLHGHKYGMYLVSNYSFFPGNRRWSRYTLTYNFLSGVQLFTVQQLSPMIARAFSKWAAVSRFRFQQVAQGTRADIRIGFYRLDHGDGYPFDGPSPVGTVLAHSFPPEDGRFHYDADENWSFNPGPNQFDLESVAVHEIGHTLSLNHSTDRSAVMYPKIQNGTTKRNLAQDDINGIRALYPQ